MEEYAVEKARRAVGELWPRTQPTVMEALRVLTRATRALEREDT
jgi:hypothetical protein